MNRWLGAGLAIVVSWGSAGSLEAQRSEFGVVAGLNSSTMSLSGTTLDSPKKRNGFVGGGFLTLRLGEILAVQPEVIFTMKGIEAVNPDQSFTTGRLQLKTDYVQIPLLVKAFLPILGDDLRPHLFAGPSIEWLVNCRVGEDTLGGTRGCADTPAIKGSDTSVIMGGGVDVIGAFTFQMRYDLGLTNLLENGGSSSAKHRTLSFMLGYIFRL